MTGWLRGASRLLTWVGGLALLVMTMWTVTDVATRYALDKPLRGSIDLVEVTLVLVVFLALPDCFLRDEQVAVDIVDHVVGPRTVALLKLFAAFATLLFLALLGYTSLQPLLDAKRFGDSKPDLPIPIWWLLAVIEFAVALSIVVLVGKFFVEVRRVIAPVAR